MIESPSNSAAHQRGHAAILIAALLAAVGMRLVALNSVPPALSADEASNAYDGYCLLKTGADRWGAHWPVVLRAFGDADYRPALMAYLTVPVQALLGPEWIVTASRLPSALLGVMTVAVVFLLVLRMFGARVAVATAVLLALNPWHIIMSRLAHESALTPLFPPLILLLLHAADMMREETPDTSVDDDMPGATGGMPSRADPTGATGGLPARAVAQVRTGILPLIAAGTAIGLSAYTYASLRLLVPALLIGVVVIYRRPLVRIVRTSRGIVALLLGSAAAGLVAAPMLVVMITRWHQVNARALSESILHTAPSFAQALATIAGQYAEHFGPTWLFIRGHPYVDQSVPGFGVLHWYALPLLIAGLFQLIRTCRSNRASGLILFWLLIYPIASATTKGGVNAARAAGGLAVFPIVCALGFDWLIQWFRRLSIPRAAWNALTAVIACSFAGWFGYAYFLAYPINPEVQARYQLEFRQAMDYLRPRQDTFDQVFISDRRSISNNWHTSEAYIFPLVYLPIAPDEFQATPIQEYSPADRVAFHFIAQFGRFSFLLNDQVLADYTAAARAGGPDGLGTRALLMARPGEVTGGQVVQRLARGAILTSPPADRARVCLELISVDLADESPHVQDIEPAASDTP